MCWVLNEWYRPSGMNGTDPVLSESTHLQVATMANSRVQVAGQELFFKRSIGSEVMATRRYNRLRGPSFSYGNVN